MLRVEDAGINASAPREQRLVDGWLVRFSPGKAKRARCIQAIAAGTLSIDDKLRRCQPLFDAAGLPLFVRITPFSEPSGLDTHLAERGMERIDDSRVMIAVTLPEPGGDAASRRADLPGNLRFERTDSRAFAEWVGQARGSSRGERDGHASRIGQAPVAHQAVVVVDDASRTIVAGGQLVVEDDLAGLYDVFTGRAHRQRGIAAALCRHLLMEASGSGARIGYLQVDAANEPARRIYRSLGFVDAYSYHYRTPRTDAA